MGPFGVDWPGLVVVIGGALTIGAALASRYSSLAIVGVLFLSYGLQILEVQTGCSPWHRSVPHLFGLGPDLFLVAAAVLMYAGRKLSARFCLVAVLVLLAMLVILLLKFDY